MPKHALTVEEAAKGGRNRGKVMLKLQKQLSKRLGMEITAEYITTILSNTTVVNTGLFILVAEFWNPSHRTNAVGGSGATLSNFSGWLNKLLFTPGGEISAVQQGIGSVAPPSLAKDLLLLSLAANIASGGNLSGILSSNTGFVAKLLEKPAAGV